MSLAGGDDASVGAHLKAFDDFQQARRFSSGSRIPLTGQLDSSQCGGDGLDAASRTAEMDAARSPVFITPSSGRWKENQDRLRHGWVSGLPDNARSSRYAPLSAQGLSGLERQVSANPQRAIEQSTGTGVIDRAKRGIAQDMVDQRNGNCPCRVDRTVEQALGLPAKQFRRPKNWARQARIESRKKMVISSGCWTCKDSCPWRSRGHWLAGLAPFVGGVLVVSVTISTQKPPTLALDFIWA